MPGDTRPHCARLARADSRRASRAGTLDDVRAKLWAAIERAETLTEDPDASTALKATHALVQACGAFVKVVEVGELEGRLADLEAARDAAPPRLAGVRR